MALDIQAPAHRADRLTRLKGADAEATGLGRMERLEQPRADELGRHARSRIDHLDGDFAIVPPNIEDHRNIAIGRIDGILH